MGVISAVGQGKPAFVQALLEAKNAFGVMRRPGRQLKSAYLGAELAPIVFSAAISKQTLRNTSLSGQAALVVLQEAWEEAQLDEVNPHRIGLIVGGSNTQQRELTQTHEAYRGREEFLRPTYGLSFMDTDLCGFCSAQFGIRGLAYTVGGASASGQLAIIQAAQAVRSEQVDVCIALGALMDLSHWECQGLHALGAMGSDRYADEPARASRPFDRGHDGFIYGELSGAVVLESRRSAESRGVHPYAALRGWGMSMDGNRNPDPSHEGQIRAISEALASAARSAAEIDYVNPHGTGSKIGDETELRAIEDSGLTGAYLNATKSIIGHGLSAAGTVEVIATLLQMRAGQLHPTRNLEDPISPAMKWARDQVIDHRIENAVTMSLGFGGINTALCWQNLDRS